MSARLSFSNPSGFSPVVPTASQAVAQSPTKSGYLSLTGEAPKSTIPAFPAKVVDLLLIANAVANLKVNGSSLPITEADQIKARKGMPGIMFWNKGRTQPSVVLLFRRHQMQWAKDLAEDLRTKEQNSEFAKFWTNLFEDSSKAKDACREVSPDEMMNGTSGESFEGWVYLSPQPKDWITFFDKHLKFTSDQVTQLVLHILPRLPKPVKPQDSATASLIQEASLFEKLQKAYQEYLISTVKKATSYASASVSASSFEGEHKSSQ